MPIPNGGAKISIKSYFVRSCFLSSSEVLGKNASIRSKLPTAACWSSQCLVETREEVVKSTCFMSKATTTDKSFTVFFAR